MASVSATQISPRAGLLNCDSEAKVFRSNGVVSLRDSAMAHHGLKTFNNVDSLSLKQKPRIISRQGSSERPENGRTGSLVIVCESAGMNIVFVCAEMEPWSTTGGLGSVLGGLPAAMAAYGHRVMAVAPRHDQYMDAWDTSVVAEVKVGDRVETVRFFHCHKRGVDRVFVDNELFLARVWGKTGSKLYGTKAGEDYPDNQMRFSLLCQAALLAPLLLNLNCSKYFSGPYGENVVFVANDWHTALLPCYLKCMYQSRGVYKNAKVAFCIHNMSYQGRFPFSDYSLLNLPDHFKSSFEFIDGHDKPVKGTKINWMKAGIAQCDKLFTVSPNYALELVSSAARGVELHGAIQEKGAIKGIANGMDEQEWNPATDKYIDMKYDASTVLQAKLALKEMLQAELGLPVDHNIPLLAFIGRLEEQKGSDIFMAAIPKFIQENVQIVVLGTGKKRMERQLEQLDVMYPTKARGLPEFNKALSHKIIAGADVMVITSRFEPCGLIQLQAMRYGTICLVSSVGGLVDTVKDGYTGFQMGAFNVDCDVVDPLDVAAVANGVGRALSVYGTPAYTEMVHNCMAQDLSWKRPAKEWEKELLSMGAVGSETMSDGVERWLHWLPKICPIHELLGCMIHLYKHA